MPCANIFLKIGKDDEVGGLVQCDICRKFIDSMEAAVVVRTAIVLACTAYFPATCQPSGDRKDLQFQRLVNVNKCFISVDMKRFEGGSRLKLLE